MAHPAFEPNQTSDKNENKAALDHNAYQFQKNFAGLQVQIPPYVPAVLAPYSA